MLRFAIAVFAVLVAVTGLSLANDNYMVGPGNSSVTPSHGYWGGWDHGGRYRGHGGGHYYDDGHYYGHGW